MRSRFKGSVVVSLLAIVFGLSLASMPGFAHHGTGSSYDNSKWVTLKGVVTEFQWTNPHSGLYMDVKDDKGNVLHYTVETGSPGTLFRDGWVKHSIVPGDHVEVTAHLSSTPGAPFAVCYSCKVVVNGKEMPRVDNRVAGPKDGETVPVLGQ